MAKRMKKFFNWIDAKKGRMKKVVISILLFLLVVGFIIMGIVFVLTLGYDSKDGWNKKSSDIKIDIEIKKNKGGSN